jgi:hypothetical protein
MIVTTSPCQEDYDNDYVCLQRIIKSRAFASHPILTAIGSQCGHVAPDLYYLSNGKLNQFLDKAIQLTKSSSDNELDELYKDFCRDIQFDGWGYCYEDSESFERYNGLKLLESLSNAVPKQLLEQYHSKVVELIKADGGKDNKTVVSFAHSTLSLIEMAIDWYRCLHEYCGFCLRVLQKVAKEAFADFASETQQVTDFANRYRDEHMLDESYHKINIDAKISPAILAIKSNGSESLVGVVDCKSSARIATKIPDPRITGCENLPIFSRSSFLTASQAERGYGKNIIKCATLSALIPNMVLDKSTPVSLKE